MPITLLNFQSAIAAALATAAAQGGNALAGIPIAIETPGTNLDSIVTPALTTGGLVLIVLEPDAGRTERASLNAVVARISTAVLLLVNPKANARPPHGAGKNPLAIVQAIWLAIGGANETGAHPAGAGHGLLTIGAEPLARIEEDNGGLLFAVDVETQIVVAP